MDECPAFLPKLYGDQMRFKRMMLQLCAKTIVIENPESLLKLGKSLSISLDLNKVAENVS